MYACPHCNATSDFIAFKDGMLVRVLEDHDDVEGLEKCNELLCTECDKWFPLPNKDPRKRQLTGELVTITGLKGSDNIKVVASGVKFRFRYDSYESDAVEALKPQPQRFVQDLLAFANHGKNTLCVRVKEDGNPNTWVYRLDKRRVRKALQLA